MTDRPRTLALLAVIVTTLLSAAAQAHWNNPCGCQRAPLYHSYSHYHHRYYLPRKRSYAAVELAPNVFAIPYRLRHYPYVSGVGAYGERGPAVIESERGVDQGQSHVIDADAQVTILGPDRMNIRLFRKGRGVVIHSDQ